MAAKKTEKSTKKPAKKTTAKSTAKVSAPQTVQEPKKETEKTDKKQQTKNRKIRIRISYLIAIAAFVILGILLYYYRALFVAAVVNGQPISRIAVIHETEKQAGAQALNTLIRDTLIQQEANKEHVTVSDKEIDDEIKNVESNLSKQGQKLDDVLKTQGMTQSDLRQLIKLDKLVQKMVGKNITISDKDVNDYIQKNKDTLPQNQSQQQLKDTVRNNLKQQQLSQKVQTWLQDLQSKAKIVQFVQY